MFALTEIRPSSLILAFEAIGLHQLLRTVPLLKPAQSGLKPVSSFAYKVHVLTVDALKSGKTASNDKLETLGGNWALFRDLNTEPKLIGPLTRLTISFTD